MKNRKPNPKPPHRSGGAARVGICTSCGKRAELYNLKCAECIEGLITK